uniref:PBPe domain-containing protein n=1 Tax=Macrostomum lignano TaxID=282301 RepID=A0A1I8FBK0_9PLAT
KVYEYCCFGYCIDLLRRLANSTPFNYNLYLVSDGTIGNKETVHSGDISDSHPAGVPDEGAKVTDIVRGGQLVHPLGVAEVFVPRLVEVRAEGERSGQVDGHCGRLVHRQADLAVAPMTITPERNLRVAFTKPFKYLGLTILVKRPGSFLQPFERTLWVLVGLSVHVVALVLYLLDRFSPLGRFKLARNQQGTDEEALNFVSAIGLPGRPVELRHRRGHARSFSPGVSGHGVGRLCHDNLWQATPPTPGRLPGAGPGQADTISGIDVMSGLKAVDQDDKKKPYYDVQSAIEM